MSSRAKKKAERVQIGDSLSMEGISEVLREVTFI